MWGSPALTPTSTDREATIETDIKDSKNIMLFCMVIREKEEKEEEEEINVKTHFV